MRVLVVRHAIAEQQEEFARTGKDDSRRPLTDDGRRKMRRGGGWLRTQDAGGTIGIVGHEPHLSGLASWLLTGRKPPFISLKKGAACLLEFREQPKAGAATLVWALTPSQLRQLGG